MQAISIKQLFPKTNTAIWMDFLELYRRIKQNFNDASYFLYSNNTRQGAFLSQLCMCFINGIDIPNMFLLSWKWYWHRRKKSAIFICLKYWMQHSWKSGKDISILSSNQLTSTQTVFFTSKERHIFLLSSDCSQLELYRKTQ